MNDVTAAVATDPAPEPARPAPRRSPRLTVVTDSELQTWRSCPNLHHFKYRERLRPLVVAKALAVGSIVHAGMSNGLRAGWPANAQSLPTSRRVELQIAAATAGIADAVSRWAGNIVAHVADADYERLAAEVDETAAMVAWMLGHYFKQTASDLTTFRLVELETPFRVAMRDRTGRPVPHLIHAGVRDAVFYDPAYNQLVLAEHKTTANDPRGIERRVEMDTQTAGYLNALVEAMAASRPIFMVDGGTVPRNAVIGRTIYNVLRKSLPHAPEVNKNGMVSVAQCSTTPEMYEAALRAQEVDRKLPRSAKQAEYLATLTGQGDRYFARVEWFRTPAEVERWRSDSFVDARRIREADRNPADRTRNTGHCNMPWSLPCAYRTICLDPDAPELRRQFVQVDDVHTEVRAAEVDAAI